MPNKLKPIGISELKPLPADLLARHWAFLTDDERFTATMYEKDDVIFVLRMHLLFETFMAKMLAIRFPDAAILLDRLAFARQVEVLHEATPLPTIMRDGLNGANWVRNRFAHLTITFTLSDAIWEKFKTYLHREYLQLIEQEIAMGHSSYPGDSSIKPDSAASRVRFGFWFIHQGLLRLVGMASDATP
jgi:hypothetical protein